MITIDAQGKTLGRVASAAAKALLGKHSASFAKNIVAEEKVTITNAKGMKVSGQKVMDKTYVRYSWYPVAQKPENYAMLTARKGNPKVIRKAVLGMLPKNRLQTPRMKKLVI